MLKDCREEMEEMEKEGKIERGKLEKRYWDQIKEMENQEEKLKDRIAELEFKLHEIAERMDNQIKYYKKEMEKDRRAYDKKNDEFNELQKNYRILETVKNQLNNELKKMAAAEEESAAHMGMTILQERNELREKYTNEMAEVRGQLAAADEAMINERIEKEDYKKLVDQMNKELDEEKSKSAQQRIKLDEMEKAGKERAQMLLDIGQLRMENDILRSNMTNRDKEIEQMAVQIKKLKKKLRKVEKNTAQEKIDLQNQLETMDFEAKARQDEANGTIENLETEIQKMKGNVETITQEKLTLLAELTELHEEVNGLLKSIDEKERERTLEKQKDAEKIENLKKENGQMKTDKEAMQEAVDRLAEEHRRIANIH